MKRKMNFNQEHINSNDSMSKALAFFEKRSKNDQVVLVGECGKLAEKVEPGYLVKLAEEIERANDFVFHNACGKLKVIEEQMNSLKKQAYQILVETKINSKLHSLPCNFSKKIGSVYSVYEKSSGECYLSMLSPQEWGETCPHNFVGSFRLESGMSWIPIDEHSATSAFRKWVSSSDDNMMITQ